MLFNSVDFIIFFPIVVLIYFIIRPKVRYLWLLVASYFFYMCWNPKYILIILFSTIVTWICGCIIDKIEHYRKVVLEIGIILNLSLLFFFKYLDFAINNINLILQKFDIQLIDKRFDLILPVGISFYIFQALGYMIDVYRKEIKAEENILKYALFVSFFPQLVAGPIERSKNLLNGIKEMENNSKWDSRRVVNGLVYMLWGFFLKMVVADNLSTVVDNVFERFYLFGTMELMVGAVFFALQIYFDFSSYSIIAIGAAQVLGFHLMENFNAPYFSESVKEFWRRWHISLSTWFRDYLYIPLGGNRKSKFRKYLNILIVFLVSGLWHGAAWTFVIWGGLHGMYQIIGELLSNVRRKLYSFIGIDIEAGGFHFLKKISTFLLVDFAWIFFRADGVRVAFEYIKRLFTKFNPWVLIDDSFWTNIGMPHFEWGMLLIFLLLAFYVDWKKYTTGLRIDTVLEKQGGFLRMLSIVGMILLIFVFGVYGGYDEKQFIYFQF